MKSISISSFIIKSRIDLYRLTIFIKYNSIKSPSSMFLALDTIIPYEPKNIICQIN